MACEFEFEDDDDNKEGEDIAESLALPLTCFILDLDDVAVAVDEDAVVFEAVTTLLPITFCIFSSSSFVVLFIYTIISVQI